jgi:hypothetical protein
LVGDRIARRFRQHRAARRARLDSDARGGVLVLARGLETRGRRLEDLAEREYL